LFSEQVLYIKCYVLPSIRRAIAAEPSCSRAFSPQINRSYLAFNVQHTLFALSLQRARAAQQDQQKAPVCSYFFIHFSPPPDIVECLQSWKAECRLDYRDQTNAFFTSKLQQRELDDLLAFVGFRGRTMGKNQMAYIPTG
jgi:hypothetical protein